MARRRNINRDIGPCMWYQQGDICSSDGDDSCEFYVAGKCMKYKQMKVDVEQRKRTDTFALTELVLAES